MMHMICEKCGAVITEPIMSIFHIETHYTRVHIFKENDGFVSERGVDLCNRCADLFNEWLMKSPKED